MSERDQVREAFEAWYQSTPLSTTPVVWAAWQAAYSAGVADERERAAKKKAREELCTCEPYSGAICDYCAAAIRSGE